MIRTKLYPLLSDAAARDRLEQELEETRMAVLELAPPDMFDLLTRGYYSSYNTPAEFAAWERQVVDEVCTKAVPVTNERGEFSDRALCPLCRGGGVSQWEPGFKRDEGLRRHLVGFGRVHQCVVTRAAFALAPRVR